MDRVSKGVIGPGCVAQNGCRNDLEPGPDVLQTDEPTGGCRALGRRAGQPNVRVGRRESSGLHARREPLGIPSPSGQALAAIP
jgi:hypothetical protein